MSTESNAEDPLALAAFYATTLFFLVISVSGAGGFQLGAMPAGVSALILGGHMLPPSRMLLMEWSLGRAFRYPDQFGMVVYLVLMFVGLVAATWAVYQALFPGSGAFYSLGIVFVVSGACAALLSRHAQTGGLWGVFAILVSGGFAAYTVLV